MILRTQYFAQNWPTCAELTKRHRNCNILQVCSAMLVTDGCHSLHKAFQSKSNEIKPWQKQIKNT